MSSKVVGVIASLWLSVFTACEPSGHARRLLEQSGGVARVNTEASAVFLKHATNEVRFLSDADLRDFPAIASLGNSVAIHPEHSGFPAHIRVRFGSHRNTRFMFIFDPTNGARTAGDWGLVQVASNIFLSAQ